MMEKHPGRMRIREDVPQAALAALSRQQGRVNTYIPKDE